MGEQRRGVGWGGDEAGNVTVLSKSESTVEIPDVPEFKADNMR